MTNAVNIAQSGSNSVTFRNRIINGAMVIDQRNAGASASTGSGTYAPYFLDRWMIAGSGGGVFSVQQSSVAPTGFTNSTLITVTTADSSIAAGDYYQFRQTIEGFNTADLGWGTAGAQPVTLSFWVRSSLTGTFGLSLRNGAFDRSYVATYTISAANTWEQKTVTIAGDTTGTWATNNTGGIVLTFSLGVGSTFETTAGAWGAGSFVATSGSVDLVGTLNATMHITGVQLEEGTAASPFEFRQYGTELMLCQRYYEVSTSAFSNVMFSGYVVSGGNSYYANGVFKVTKRANPTVTLTSTFGSGFNNTSGTAEGISPESFYEGRSSTATVNNGFFSSTFKASAEL